MKQKKGFTNFRLIQMMSLRIIFMEFFHFMCVTTPTQALFAITWNARLPSAKKFLSMSCQSFGLFYYVHRSKKWPM